MKKHLLLLILMGSTSLVHAQSEAGIRGMIQARADSSLQPGATIQLEGTLLATPLQTTAGDDGRFVFSRLAPGEYRLAVTHNGFQDRRYTVSLKPREVRNLIVDLDLRPLQESITVSSEAIPTTHSPSSTLFTSERLDSLPLPQKSNLPDLIVSAAPGMIRGHDDFVHIRGSEIALNPFINGVAFQDNPHALFSAGIGADYIASMNIMTGGFSAEYGNRFGGVLDIVTKSGFGMNNTGSVSLGVGTALRHNASVEFGGHTERVAYYLNVGGFESARFLSPPDPLSLHNTGRGARSFLQFDFVANPRNSFRLALLGDATNFEIPKTSQDAELRPDLESLARTRSQSLIASWDHARSPNTLIQTTFYERSSRARLLPNDDAYGAKADVNRRLTTTGLKSDATHFFGRNAVKVGVDMALLEPNEQLYYLSQPWIDFTHLIGSGHIHFRGPNLGTDIPRPVVFEQKETGSQVSVYVQDKVQLSERLTADAGLRYDRYSLAVSASHFSPRLNIAYTLPTGAMLHGSYNHFFVPPPIENILMNSAGLTRFISEIGNALPPLRPITEDQVEAGIMQPLGRAVKVGVTGYYRLSDNPVHTVVFPDVRVYGYANFDKGEAYGMEMKAEVPIQSIGLSSYMNYALGRVWFFNPITAGFTTEAAHINERSRFPAPMDQTHTATAGFTYKPAPTGLWASMAFEYGSGTPAGHGGADHEHEAGEAEHGHATATESPRVPQHFAQNLSLGWDGMLNDRQKLSFQFNVENLSNNMYLVAKESVFTPGQYSIPRMYSASMKVHF